MDMEDTTMVGDVAVADTTMVEDVAVMTMVVDVVDTTTVVDVVDTTTVVATTTAVDPTTVVDVVVVAEDADTVAADVPTTEEDASVVPHLQKQLLTNKLKTDDHAWKHQGTRTIGVISKVDQASVDPKVLAACQALLLAQSGSVGFDNSLETAWRAESESLKSILTGAPQSKLGILALVETLAHQIRSRMKIRLLSLLSGLQGKSQIVQDELVRLGESMVSSSEGTRALAELCRELRTSIWVMGSGWKVVASFEGNFPDRIKQLPLDRHFDINNVKRMVTNLISPEKGLRSLIKTVLEMAKEPLRLCVDEVHRVLVDIVTASSANATPGLRKYPPFKRGVFVALCV
ncbi:dynamin-like protein 6 [Tanacetum coccineum]